MDKYWQMLAPPYQQPPGGSTTMKPFYPCRLHSEHTGPEITAVCFTREKVIFNLQGSSAGCSFSDAAAHCLLRSVCWIWQRARWTTGQCTPIRHQRGGGWMGWDRYINGEIISRMINESYRVLLLTWAAGQSGWIKLIDFLNIKGSLLSLLLL